MASSEWLRRAAHVEGLRRVGTEEGSGTTEVRVRHHCHHAHEHHSWVTAPAVLADRTPPYTVAVLVNRQDCDIVRFDHGETVNAAGLVVAVAALVAIIVIIVLVIIL